MTTPPTYSIISARHVEERFSLSDEIWYPFLDFAEDQEQHLHEGPLHVHGDFKGDESVDWQPANKIVDGDLTVDGDFSWFDYSGGSYVLVNGTLRCRNLILDGCPAIVVRGDLIVEGSILGHYGDDGGLLIVRGDCQAKHIFNILYFNMEFASQPQAILVSDEYRLTGAVVDFSDDELQEILLPEHLDSDGEVDSRALEKLILAGTPLLRASAVPSHLKVQKKLEELSEDPHQVAALDLSDQKLRSFPEILFSFIHLKELNLSGNQISLPDRFSELPALTSLNLSKMGLEALPESVTTLSRLERLDLGDNPLEGLPERFGELQSLRVLSLESVDCPLPESFGGLHSLEELDMSYIGEHGEGTVTLPAPLFRLKNLRKLDLRNTILGESIPHELENLASLEELNLDGALGHVDTLPPLHALPKLKVLNFNGNRGNASREPSPELLHQIWNIGSLEELGVDRWGEKTSYSREKKKHLVVRPALTKLPDDAFSKMPRLKRLDLSFNELETLPESFYALQNLEFVDLRYTHLDAATLKRLGETFPKVRMDLRNVPLKSQAVDNPHWQKVHTLVKEGGALLTSERPVAVAKFEAAIALCTPGAPFSDYDELYAYYGLVDALGNMALTMEGEELEAVSHKIIKYATCALERVPAPGSIFHFTDQGAFQEEVTRRAGNALAWHLMELGQLTQAEKAIDRALSYADGAQYNWIRDTKVRILLAQERHDEAYAIVDRILTQDPQFKDFQDLKHDPTFEAWQKNSR